jgi:hypothetical protein
MMIAGKWHSERKNPQHNKNDPDDHNWLHKDSPLAA